MILMFQDVRCSSFFCTKKTASVFSPCAEVGEQARQARLGRRGGFAGRIPGGAGDDDGPAPLGDAW